MISTIFPARHAFTTRYGGVSRGKMASLNLTLREGDFPENVRENLRRFGEVMGAGVDDFAVTHQVHENVVRIVDNRDRHICLSDVPYDADGIVTKEKGLPVMCFTADCVPVLLCDSEKKTAAAVHCGWRSSVGDILGEAVKKMCSLGAEPEKIFAAVGPAIGACCFETDEDVPQAVESWLSGDTEGLFRKKENGKTLVDLRSADKRRLMQLGVPETQIDISDECTFCSHEKYWSHRYTKGERGGQAACVVLE
ncbi:MAG: peptidoglycan editing factor PgeF [Eubacterium sp.]|nr:peptidoglycan editing factor PgeF [Eubacterium sp.]